MGRHRRRKFRHMYRRFNRNRMMTRFLMMVIIFLLIYIVTGGRVLFFWFLPFFLFLPFSWMNRRSPRHRDWHDHEFYDDDDEDDVHYV